MIELHVVSAILSGIATVLFTFYAGRLTPVMPIWEKVVRLGIFLCFFGVTGRFINLAVDGADFYATQLPVAIAFAVIDAGYAYRFLEVRKHKHAKLP